MASRASTLRPEIDQEGTTEKYKIVDRQDDSQLEKGRPRPSWKERRASGKESEQDMDDPFGEEEGEGVKYRTLKWWYV